MQASFGVSCNVDIPGVNRLTRHSPSIEYTVNHYTSNVDVLAFCRGQVDGAVSPLLGLRRPSRTGFSVPFSFDSTQQESSLGRLDVRSPSESGSTSIEINRVPRTTPEMTILANNSSVCLTDHDPEGADLTPSDYSHLFGSMRTTESIELFDEGDETSMSLNSRPRSCSLDNICLIDGYDASRTKSQLDYTMPDDGPLAVDLNKHISDNETTDETSLREARCSNGVEIFGSPPTALCGIGPQDMYGECSSSSISKKPDIKGSIILAGLFTGVAVIVGAISSRANKE